VDVGHPDRTCQLFLIPKFVTGTNVGDPMVDDQSNLLNRTWGQSPVKHDPGGLHATPSHANADGSAISIGRAGEGLASSGQAIDCNIPPSIRRAAPFVAEDSGLAM
jgi:hypothetical protein